MIKVGVIGLGMMGQMHLAAWSGIKGTRLRMVADTDPRRAAGDFSGSWSNMEGGASSIDFSKVTGTSDPMELIHSDDVDVVDICVPTPFHLDLALAAIKAGKHVLCEKPLARTAADARRIARAAEKGSGYFQPAMCLRFWPLCGARPSMLRSPVRSPLSLLRYRPLFGGPTSLWILPAQTPPSLLYYRPLFGVFTSF